MHHPDDTSAGQERFPQGSAQFAGEFIDFQRLINLLRAKAWIIAAIVGVIVLAALGYILWAPKIYESRAVIQCPTESQKVLKIDNVSEEKPESGDYLNTVVTCLYKQEVDAAGY